MHRQTPFPFTEELSDEEDDTNKEDDNPEELYLVGYAQVSVLGLQYYDGTVTDNEIVQLIREPHNPDDINSMWVNNIRGERLGYVERDKACYLATLVDQKLVVIEGVVCSKSFRDSYRMPCNVYFFSRLPSMEFVRRLISDYGFQLITPREDDFILQQQEAKAAPEKVMSRDEQKRKIDNMFETLIQSSSKRQSMEPSSVITCKLMQHQKEALAWMVERENGSGLPPFWEAEIEKGSKEIIYKNTITNYSSKYRPDALRGGILADDMGLGKTLELISLIATNKPGAVLPPVVDIFQSPVQKPDEDANPPKKRKKLEEKENRSKKCTPKLADKSLSIADPSPCPPKLGGPRATLIVCPLTVLSNWVEQLSEHTRQGSLDVHLYHGADRAKDAKILASNDVVLTTYGILAKERNLPNSLLEKVHWLRVILDEAHLVKSPCAQQTSATVSLEADRRWAVTGTPIQNSYKDLFSLMMFLKLQPLNDRYFWTHTIQRPLLSGERSGFSRLQGLMSAIALRRTKETQIDGHRLVELPPKVVTVYPVELSSEHRRVYDQMELKGKNLVGNFIEAGTTLQNYANVLSIILRLRQICDHAALCPEHADLLAAASSSQGPSLASPELLQKLLAQTGEEFDCPICLSPPHSAVITRCAHVFCQRCIQRTLMCDKKSCPLCRFALTDSDVFSAPLDEAENESVTDSNVKSSAKIDALISLLQETREREPLIKSVVFSQFPKMLTFAQQPLKDAGFKFVRIDGSMSATKRKEALQAFKSTKSKSPTVFLLTLKAAGTGLNLTSASHVYMLDPWWNPAVDEQAMDRVHRLGQTREVHIFRLIVADSIEERILDLQKRKRQFAQVAFGKSQEQQRLMRVEEVRLLMRV
ncbi:hypothetical protein O6H91_05G038800 [Diphasiastrum complanatum]|uniref:Uncharacterized protein n=1 Tax=Diphasiastrum complanatum TaxID=34168 RepID=A0ACC2DMW8_DIPCM|nr:hypothetical protein O6H91_05G038800 [Diphasiastrum complanatum]